MVNNVPTISLCMITKNEEQFLEQCLNSIKDLVDEIIIVDTGSTDQTKEIAARFTDKIFNFTWNDDFSAARNESLKHATGDWILVLDADETLDDQGKEKIKQAILSEDHHVSAYSLPQLHYTNKYVHHVDFVETNDSQFKGFFASYVIRLFKNLKEINFEYCVHETVRETIFKLGGEIKDLAAPIHHYQELKGIDDIAKKQEFYFRLSLNNIKKYPQYAKSYNDVAIYYSSCQNDQEKALGYCKKAVELEPTKIEYLLNLSYRLRDLERYQEAIKVLQDALKLSQNERVFTALGFIYYALKEYEQALVYYRKALELNPAAKEHILANINIIQNEMEKNKK